MRRSVLRRMAADNAEVLQGRRYRFGRLFHDPKYKSPPSLKMPSRPTGLNSTIDELAMLMHPTYRMPSQPILSP